MAGDDILWLWSRGDMNGTFTAGRRIGNNDPSYRYAPIQVFGSMNATVQAGLGNATSDGYWGEIDGVSAWGSIAGSITADHGGSIQSGRDDTATINYTTPPTQSASDVTVFGNYPADPSISLNAAQSALQQAKGQVAQVATALSQSQAAAANAWRAAQAQLAVQKQQLSDAVTQGTAAAQTAITQTSREVSLLLAQDQAQGKQPLNQAFVQVSQGIASAQNAAAQEKVQIQQALDDSGRQIAADTARLLQSKVQQQADAATLVSTQQMQYTISLKNLAVKNSGWTYQFNAQADADFSLYLKELWADSAKLRETIHNVLSGVSVATTFLPVVGLVVGRVADGLNAALYLAEGNYLQAGLCSISFIPFGRLFGHAAEGARVVENLGNEAGLAARLSEDAGAGLARTAGEDAAQVENALSREIADAERGASEVAPNVENEAGALNKCEDELGNPISEGCFAAGTEVETANGGEEPIQDVKVGDQVESRDQFNSNAPVQVETVTAVYRHTVTDLRDVTITGTDGSTETIHATDEHPFYVQNAGWVDAQALTTGEKVEEPDGSWATVSGNVDEPHPEGIAVYNFEVDVNHTYFVSQGGAWVWVHNAPCPKKILGGLYKDVRAANIGGEVHHMPAFAAVKEALGKASFRNLPSIWMKEADHALTASFRNTPEAIAWREMQVELIQQGNRGIKSAIKRDILDVRELFGSKYDVGIKQMLASLDKSIRPAIFF